ncbi:MAG: LysR family transcriptional regulator [Clostridia bacterium]|nr:LysR family transcriptional regulator [Clostridia bacterium]
MDTKKLEVLLKAIETGNLTAAGDEMGFTQSGVSHLIKSIENELGFQLLIRGKNGVRLTPDGEELLPTIREIVNATERLSQYSSNIRGMSSGRIRIGTYTSVSIFWMPRIIQQFSRDYPGIRIELAELDNDPLIEKQLSDGTIDFAFMSNPSGLNEWIPLANDRIVALLPNGHPLAEKEFLSLSDIVNQPFIMPSAGFDSDIKHIIDGLESGPRVVFSSMDFRAIVAMVQHGLGISVVPEMILSDIKTDVVIKEFSPCQYRPLGIAVRSLSNASLAARTFIKYARTAITGIPMEEYNFQRSTEDEDSM